jgi:hypothetical protein
MARISSLVGAPAGMEMAAQRSVRSIRFDPSDRHSLAPILELGQSSAKSGDRQMEQRWKTPKRWLQPDPSTGP